MCGGEVRGSQVRRSKRPKGALRGQELETFYVDYGVELRRKDDGPAVGGGGEGPRDVAGSPRYAYRALATPARTERRSRGDGLRAEGEDGGEEWE